MQSGCRCVTIRYVAARIVTTENLSFNDLLIRPQYSEVRTRDDVSLVTELGCGLKLDIPIIAANMDTVCGGTMATTMAGFGGMGVLHRALTPGQRLQEIRLLKINDQSVGVAVGIHSLLAEIKAYIDAGVSAIVLDIAHGDSAHALDKIHTIRSLVEKNNPSICVVGGNVATARAVERMWNAGAHSVKVGIGPGSACTTRIKTGVGVPQVTAIAECAAIADGYGMSTIADGGMKTPGDVAKALALGADAVMLGGMLAGTDEAPGNVVKIGGKSFKEFRGMASKKAGSNYEEGASGMVSYKGPTGDIIQEICKGLRSAFSYSGAFNMEQFHAKAELLKVSPLAAQMSGAHGLSV